MVERVDRRRAPPEDERALAELTPQQARQLVFQAVCAIRLGATVLLDFLVRIVAVTLDDLLTAVDLVGAIFKLGCEPTEQKDGLLGAALERLVEQARACGR